MIRAEEILEFWFGILTRDDLFPEEKAGSWFAGSPAIDREIKDRFGADLERARDGTYVHWEVSPRGRLALILIFDQFTRNIHRGTAGMFADDPRALSLVTTGIDLRMDPLLRPIERAFFYMPLQHSEDLAMQDLSMERYATLIQAAPEAIQEELEEFHLFAAKHRDIILDFGRFPHRNEILGRASTAGELAFLRQPGSSF